VTADPLQRVWDAAERIHLRPEGKLWRFTFVCSVDAEHGRSVMVIEGMEGEAVLYPSCGCDPHVVTLALGLRTRDLFPPEPRVSHKSRRASRRYEPEAARAEDAEPITWLWRHWLPLATTALLIGEEEVGKGVWVAWLIARISRGELEGRWQGHSRRVLVVAGEDSWRKVWIPRLVAAGADLAMVHRLAPSADGEQLDVRADAGEVRRLAQEHDYVLVYFDQLLDNMPDDVIEVRAKAVRRALAPLGAVVAELDIVTLATLHPNKGGGDARDRIYGTHAWRALARSVIWMVPDLADRDRRFVIVDKGNWVKASAKPARSLAIGSWEGMIGGRRFDAPMVADVRASEMTMREWLDEQRPDSRTTKLERAEAVIEYALRDGDWVACKPIQEWLASVDVPERRTQEAAKRLGVERERREMGGPMWWRLTRAGAREGVRGAGQRDLYTGFRRASAAVPRGHSRARARALARGRPRIQRRRAQLGDLRLRPRGDQMSTATQWRHRPSMTASCRWRPSAAPASSARWPSWTCATRCASSAARTPSCATRPWPRPAAACDGRGPRAPAG
jgi:AAA domain